MNEFNTIYRVDYYPKTNKYLRPRKMEYIPGEYRDPINEAFRAHMDVEKSEGDCMEDMDSYYNKAKEEYPCVAKMLPNKKEPIDKKVINKQKIYNNRTTYQVHYCDIEKEIAFKEFERQNAVHLPPDVIIPFTSQLSGYREPKMINPRAYHRDPVPKAKNNLKPDYKVRKIMNVTTGCSDYSHTIGNLGRKIIETEMHGLVHHDFKGKYF